jgi:hypothetical protein
MSLEVRIVIAVNDACPSEFTHVLGGVDEEDLMILKYEVESGIAFLAENLLAGDIEELDADSDGSFEIPNGRNCVGGNANPSLIFAARENADLQVIRQAFPDAKPSVRNTVWLEEHRAKGGTLSFLDST